MPVSLDGWLDLEKEFGELIKAAKDTDAILTVAAKDFTSDLLKLPTPRSNKTNSRHLVDSFVYKKNEKGPGMVIGWGRFYGRMVERGHRKRSGRGRVAAQPHFLPLWNKNKDKYYNKMIKKLKLD